MDLGPPQNRDPRPNIVRKKMGKSRSGGSGSCSASVRIFSGEKRSNILSPTPALGTPAPIYIPVVRGEVFTEKWVS